MGYSIKRQLEGNNHRTQGEKCASESETTREKIAKVDHGEEKKLIAKVRRIDNYLKQNVGDSMFFFLFSLYVFGEAT